MGDQFEDLKTTQPTYNELGLLLRAKTPKRDMRRIQVDGGSELMVEFEAACQAKGVALYVLPPRCPQMSRL
jgi:hypothetical protein